MFKEGQPQFNPAEPEQKPQRQRRYIDTTTGEPVELGDIKTGYVDYKNVRYVGDCPDSKFKKMLKKLPRDKQGKPIMQGQEITFEGEPKVKLGKREWMLDPDGQAYCPDCWPKILERIKKEDEESEIKDPDDYFPTLDGFIKDSVPARQYPRPDSEEGGHWCEECGKSEK